MALTVRQLNRILAAKRDNQDDYEWDDDDGEFVDADGKPVGKKKILLLLLLLIKFGRASANVISTDLVDGDITTAQWSDRMSSLISSLAISSAVLAYGGVDNLTPERQTLVEALIDGQQALLDKFTAQIVSGDYPIGDGLIARSELYPGAVHAQYQALVRQRETANGALWEMRVMGDSVQPCDDCPDLAGYWAPIGTLPAIGSVSCDVGCRCDMEFSDSPTMPSLDDGDDSET